MQTKATHYRHLAFAALASLPIAAAAAAGDTADWQGWTKMNEHVVSAEHILRAEVSNGVNPVANVTDLVLTPDRRAVQYVLYGSAYPFALYGSDNGFVAFGDVNIVNAATPDAELVIKNDQAARAPETLKLTASQAANRLVSQIIGSQLYFSDGGSREIRDLLIDKKSGDIAAYVVKMDPESLFNSEPRAIPADHVTIDESRISADLNLESVEDMRKLDAAHL